MIGDRFEKKSTNRIGLANNSKGEEKKKERELQKVSTKNGKERYIEASPKSDDDGEQLQLGR